MNSDVNNTVISAVQNAGGQPVPHSSANGATGFCLGKTLSSINPPNDNPKMSGKWRRFRRRWEASTSPVSKISSRRVKLYFLWDTILPCTRKCCGENLLPNPLQNVQRRKWRYPSPLLLSTSLPNQREPFLSDCWTLQSLTLSSRKFAPSPMEKQICKIIVKLFSHLR